MTDPAAGGLPPLPQVSTGQHDRIERRRAFLREQLISLWLVVGWFTVVGLLGALIWVAVTPLPGFTRVFNGSTMNEEQLAKQFSANGWFLVIAVVGGLVSGLVLLLIRRRAQPAVMVVLVGLGGGLATLLMVQFGLAWGPADPGIALAQAEIGEVVSVQLTVDAHGVYYAWSVASLVGAAIALWFLDSRDPAREGSGLEPDADRVRE